MNHLHQGGINSISTEICVENTLSLLDMCDSMPIAHYCATTDQHRQLYRQLHLSYAMLDITEDVFSERHEFDFCPQNGEMQDSNATNQLADYAEWGDISVKIIHTWADR